MILTLIAAACLVCAAALWRGSFGFTVDATPIGATMMAVAGFLAAISLFLFGIAIGKANAQQGSWPIPRPFSTVRTPDPVPVVRSEEPITTMAQARRAAER